MPETPEKNEGQKPQDAARSGKQVDEGWKEEARREKERIAAEAKAEGGEKPDKPAGKRTYGELPPASFELMVSSYAIQALIGLGQVPNPMTGKSEPDLGHAKHAIDLLSVLEEKTRGNLTDAEKKMLESTLYDLRLRYVNYARA